MAAPWHGTAEAPPPPPPRTPPPLLGKLPMVSRLRGITSSHMLFKRKEA